MAADSTEASANAASNASPLSLPRSFRGYNRRATEELFRRLSWEYGVLAGEHRKLEQTLQEPRPAPPRGRRDLDDEAHLLLAAAHKAARDLRESVRVECDQALQKAKGRAAEIEAEANRAAGESATILKRAAELRATLSEALQRLEQGELPAPLPARSHVSADARDAKAP